VLQNLEKKAKDVTKEREDLKKHNSSLREKLKSLRNDIKILLDASGKNGIRNEGPTSIPELPAPMETETDATPINAIAPVPPVSVATQTMPLAKKANVEPVQASEDEEINVDEVTES
jgi:hypothetical protein